MPTAQVSYTPDSVHLVGSIGLNSVDEIFQTVGRVLGRRLKRVPDGEVGGRRHWITWQYPLLRSSFYLAPDPSGAVHRKSRLPILGLANDIDPEEIQFGELGYAREARSSYQDFCAARARGVLPSNAKFQVCLPTPMAVIYAYCREQDVLAIYRAYERDMIHEVDAICAAIPHHDLCIQWDVCHEMLIWDGQPLDMFPKIGSSKDEIIVRLQRMCQAVPPDAELGIHLCYGDFGARHFLEPRDAGKMVELANALFAATERSIDFLHMPVPIERTDDAFFLRLRELKLPPATEFYLGGVNQLRRTCPRHSAFRRDAEISHVLAGSFDALLSSLKPVGGVHDVARSAGRPRPRARRRSAWQARVPHRARRGRRPGTDCRTPGSQR